MNLLKAEILRVLRTRGALPYVGLEDRCNSWESPQQLRTGELVVAGDVRVTAVPLKPHGSMLIYGTAAQ